MMIQFLNMFARPLVWFHYKSKNLRLAGKARLHRSAKVLEIGSGHNPWFRSNVLCDRFLHDNTERNGDLQKTKPLVIADGTYLPFRNDSFDFIFASHVSEHIDRLDKYFQEIQRIAKAGYLETPNYLFEQSIGTTTHLWSFWIENNVLCAERKWIAGAPERVYHGMHRALAKNAFFHLANIMTPETGALRFWWKRPFDFKLYPPPFPMDSTKSKG